MKKYLIITLIFCANNFAQTPEPLKSLTHTTNFIQATVWNDGFIGQNPVDGRSGTFSWKGTEGISTAGIVYGTTSVGTVIGSYGEAVNYIDDWRNVESNFAGGFTEEIIGSVFFDQVSKTKINDSGVPNQSYGLGFNVLQKSYSKSDENVIFFRYGFINTTGEDIADLYVGHTTDWNIGSYHSNAGGIEPSLNLTYISRTDSTGPYFGVVAIDSLIGCKFSNAIPANIRVETFNYISIFDPTIPTSGDLSTVGGTYVDNIVKEDTAWVTFAYIAGDNLSDLKINAQKAIDIADIAEESNWINSDITAVEKNNLANNTYVLQQNYPNPFNPSTKISYVLPFSQNSLIGNVKLGVYDVLGRELEILVNEKQKPGFYEVTWNASNMPSGVYFYKLTAGSFVETRKMLLIK